MNRPLLIAIEGIDGAGKQTQAKNLATHFGARVHSFPHYQSTTGQLLRQHLTGKWEMASYVPAGAEDNINAYYNGLGGTTSDLLLRQCLMTINRYERQRHIRDDLARGHVVLDRWWLSLLAYGIVEGFDRDFIVEILRELLDLDIWILIDIPADVGAARRRYQARDKNEADFVKLTKARDAYVAEFASMSVGRSNRAVIIDGNRPQEEVYLDITRAVARVL
jgi:thymidylate kinase